MPESDLALKKLGLKNIKRWEYQEYDVRIVLPKASRARRRTRYSPNSSRS